jgi:hypothetical protein
MGKKPGILWILLLIFPGKKLWAGTGNASDGLLSFLVLLGFLLFLLGMVHRAESLKTRYRKFMDEIGIDDLLIH